jgi:cyclophilin family peptidyl-prolyl cis-trans isomerase
MTNFRSILFVFCYFSLCVALIAQEPITPPRPETTPQPIPTPQTTPQPDQSEAEAAELGPKNKVFMESFTEFRELVKKVSAMTVEYQTATPDRQKEIDAARSELIKQGHELRKKMTESGLDAHDETPNRNRFAMNQIYGTFADEFQRENYEETVRIFKRLSASGIDKNFEQFYAFAAFAAVLTSNYDEAEAWMKKATEGGHLDAVFRNLEQSEAGMDLAKTFQNQIRTMPAVKAAWAKELEIRKAETEAGEKDPAKKLPRVELNTTKGVIVLELFENEAPNTVANFISLVEEGFYNGVVFHRVLPTFMAQGGDPTGTGRGGPGYTFDDECGENFPNKRKHFRGSISMANAGPNTNGSQFFLTFVPTSFLDGRHTVFGRVVEGIEVLADIQRVDPSDRDTQIPELDKIKTAKVLNKRDHAYKVKKSAEQ